MIIRGYIKQNLEEATHRTNTAVNEIGNHPITDWLTTRVQNNLLLIKLNLFSFSMCVLHESFLI